MRALEKVHLTHSKVKQKVMQKVYGLILKEQSMRWETETMDLKKLKSRELFLLMKRWTSPGLLQIEKNGKVSH